MNALTNGTTKQGPPIEYPVVEIGGRFYTVIFSLYAQYRLDRQGVDLASVFQLLKPATLPDGSIDKDAPGKPGRVAAMMELFTACTAHNFTENHEPVRTAEEWATMIPLDKWVECCTAVWASMRKVQPSTAPSPAPAATTEAGPALQ